MGASTSKFANKSLCEAEAPIFGKSLGGSCLIALRVSPPLTEMSRSYFAKSPFFLSRTK